MSDPATRAAVDLTPPAPVAADPGSEPKSLRHLTAREREIFGLLANGLSNRQMARTLYISPRTVEVHVSNLLAKLGVHTRLEAAAISHQLHRSSPRSEKESRT